MKLAPFAHGLTCRGLRWGKNWPSYTSACQPQLRYPRGVELTEEPSDTAHTCASYLPIIPKAILGLLVMWTVTDTNGSSNLQNEYVVVNKT